MGKSEKPIADRSTGRTKGIYLVGHQTAHEAKTIDSICWEGRASHKVRMCGRHGEVHTWERPCGKRNVKKKEETPNNPFHMGIKIYSTQIQESIDHRFSFYLLYVYSFVKQPYTSDFEIYL